VLKAYIKRYFVKRFCYRRRLPISEEDCTVLEEMRDIEQQKN